MGNATTSLNEAALAKAAAEKSTKDGIRPGHPLPEGFKNPEIGSPGHLCVSPPPRRAYQPEWYSIIIHESDLSGANAMQYFCDNGNEYYVKVGTWVDVPPAIHSILLNCYVEVIEQDYTAEDLRLGRPAQRTVKKVPRFSFSAIRSA